MQEPSQKVATCPEQGGGSKLLWGSSTLVGIEKLVRVAWKWMELNTGYSYEKTIKAL